MAEEPVAVTDLEKANIAWMANHLRTYLESGGTEGHVIDMSHLGGHPTSVTLILKTIGRKSGEPRLIPLLYSYIGGEFLLMASRGGADIHPAWYFNMTAADTVDIQVGPQAFRCTWRVLEGAERERAWAISVTNYPPVEGYTEHTDRVFPLVALKPVEGIGLFG
jgi:deazaflavin-dependent oxidoreductase (nitroreductase family)